MLQSSEGGLDQSFNSLHALTRGGRDLREEPGQQASEGWRVLPALYDDGEFSGGTMERPGLRRLLADVDAGLIDVVAVYKIDL